MLFSQAQDENALFKNMVTDSLAKTLFGNYNDSTKILVNRQLEILMNDFLSEEQSVGFNFDSLRFVKAVQPENREFNLITWAVPLNDGSHLYSGFLQKILKNKPTQIIQLRKSSSPSDEKSIYHKDNWPSAVYTRLIESTIQHGKFYTLIGWMGGKEGISRRVLEVLSFNEDGMPVFGAPVFSLDKKPMKSRIIFEFTDQIPFHLDYEQQRLPGKKNKKGWMIVFNHLSGNSPHFRNTYNALVPNYDKFDGFIFDGEKWNFVKDIDVRMDNENAPQYKPPAEIGLEPR